MGIVVHQRLCRHRNQLAEQPAVGLFAKLGWQTMSAKEEALGANGTLPRETGAEVVLVFRLRAALERLNPALACPMWQSAT